ncbi:MAG: T9SS type A sorting domain-containing protein [Bacteroidales bacterium]|nr:T9SS type A sorting domain-containing protein [Bacteroidales bacterium]
MKSLLSASLACLFMLSAYSQTNHAPVAVSDTVEVVSQISTIIDVLANDYDPDGDYFRINWFSAPYDGEVDTVDNQFLFKSGNSMDGLSFFYKIKDEGNPPETSQVARVRITLSVNQDVPIAVKDTFEILELVPVELDVISNDFDLNSDELKIAGIKNTYKCEVMISDDSLHVIVIPDFYYYSDASFYYFIRESNSKEKYLSDWVKVWLNILQNPDIPIAMPDTGYSTGGVPVSIPVLENDYDPQGESLEIKKIKSISNGTAIQSGDQIIYTPTISFTGIGGFSYNIREANDTNIYSHITDVKVFVTKNPDCPVGIADHVRGMTATPIVIDVLANDYDSNGDLLAVKDLQTSGAAEISGNKIVYTSDPLAYPRDSLFYRAAQVNDNNYFSEWTKVIIDLTINPALPVAVTDSIDALFAYSVTISPLANDIPNSADSIKILSVKSSSTGLATKISDSLVVYRSYTNAGCLDSITYIIGENTESELKAWGKIYITIPDHHYYDSLTINRINAGINADGMLFGNIGQFPGEGLEGDFKSHFNYPAGEETKTIFNSILWVGGITGIDSLHFAGENYRQFGSDFQPGPISDSYDEHFTKRFWKLWKLTRSDINYHRSNWWKEDYSPISDISAWPGNGNEYSGEALQLAPYFDFNFDEKYDPTDGDYPLIRGDQCIFFMMNDDKEHTESQGERLKVEVHGMAYVFDAPGDSAMAHSVFVHYDLINRSENIYNEIYTGIFTDFDLGNPWDDYIGSDVMRNSYYCYNGNKNDMDHPYPDYTILGYGLYPPAQSVTLLGGPFLDPDGIDNFPGECDAGIIGTNFGNGVPDDERSGFTNFMYFISNIWDPEIFDDKYNFMKSIWRDGHHLVFGGVGHSDAGGLECRYQFPGDSDPLNFGTGCITPPPPFDQEGFYWTDSITNPPGDRRGIGSMGPFTFKPGDVQEIELAYVVANGWNGPVSSVDKLMEYIDTLRARVQNGGLIVPNSELGYNEPSKIPGSLKIYPNPASDFVVVDLKGIESGCEYAIYDLFGRMVLSGILSFQAQNVVNTNGLSSGLYVLMVKTDDLIYSGKIIKR